MVSSPLCFSTDSSSQSSSVCGLVRVVPRSSPSSVLRESGRSQCLGLRRFFLPLVGLPRVCLPSVCSPSESSREGGFGPDFPSSDCSFLAQETLVSSASVLVSRSAEVSPGFSGPSTSTGLSYSAFHPGNASSYSLAALRSAGREAGLPIRAADLAARHLRPSSRTTYDSRLGPFVKLCAGLQADPHHASLAVVADFFISLYDENKALATIMSYWSAIASIHRGFPDGSTVSSS